MTTLSFWKGMVITMALTIAILFTIDLVLPSADAFGGFNLTTIGIFTAIVFGAYHLAQLAVRSESKSRFIQLVMMIIVVKMIICVLLIAIYIKINAPSSRLFVIPFLAIYLIFTIFEVIVLERIAKAKVPDN